MTNLSLKTRVLEYSDLQLVWEFKYSGVILDRRITFKAYINYIIITISFK